MGALVGVMESRFLDGFEVTNRTREMLIANGWQPPADSPSTSTATTSDRPRPPQPSTQVTAALGKRSR